jgi:hypothetical protein
MSSFKLMWRLFDVLEQEIEKHALKPSCTCVLRLHRLIKIGIDRLRIAHAEKNQAIVYLTENNIKNLVEFLANVARSKGSYPNIGDTTLEKTIAECYPLWPYK